MFFKADNETIKTLFSKYHHSLKAFLDLNQFLESLKSINSNTSQMESFKKRFYQWFDAFKVLKYMNFVHQDFYTKELVIVCLKSFLSYTSRNIDCNLNEKEFLAQLRNEEKNNISW